MDKMAQRRGIFNQLREKANMPGKYLEGFFRPELDRVMKSLTNLDDRIRADLSGEKIGEAAAPEDKVSAKDLVKRARTNFNRREYVAGIVDLGHFHKKMADVAKSILEFETIDLDSIHTKFLFNGLPKDYENKLQTFREYMAGKTASSNVSDELIKEAGIMDFFANIATKRGRSLMAWEKKYPKKTKALREGGMQLVEVAQDLLDNTLTNLKEMATARATRRPDAYVEVAKRIVADYNKFDKGPKGFSSYYTTVLVPFLKTKDEIEAKEKAATEKQLAEENKQKQENNVFNQEPAQPAAPQVSAPIGPPAGVGTSSPPFAPQPQQAWPFGEQNKPTTPQPKELKEEIDPLTGEVRRAHQNFYQSLQSMSQEDPRILASYIAKYASSIQNNDLETSIKLMSLVKNIRG
jgi:hypothetical protein